MVHWISNCKRTVTLYYRYSLCRIQPVGKLYCAVYLLVVNFRADYIIFCTVIYKAVCKMQPRCVHLLLSLGLLVVELSAQLGENVKYRPDQCLPGDKHKELASPEPEGPDYQACHQWREQTCCTAEFTQMLAHANITNIDGFHWNRCGDLSPSCQQFFVRVECFYRCSPHVAHWALLQFDSALANLPVCHEFCDEWFEACKDDLTCAENWITDWNYTNGENHCTDNSDCRKYSDVYGSGRGICERLWGQSFIYSDDSQDNPERQCMTLWWPEGDPNPNTRAIDNIFEDRDTSNIAYRPDQCLPGDKHKELASPEPEGPDYQACHQWREQTCCTAELTQVLAHANVTNIDGFHWNRCGDLSPSCQQFFVRVECFYRCSPHVAHWALLQFDSALANLPVCHEFCDEWFEACKDDLTCAENWITDWLYINGENFCKDPVGKPCRAFSEVYGSGRGICERLWGQSFIYSDDSQDDPERQCMTLWWPEGDPNPNTLAIDNIFGGGASSVGGTLCSMLLAAITVVWLI